jgi:hypothetical protein
VQVEQEEVYLEVEGLNHLLVVCLEVEALNHLLKELLSLVRNNPKQVPVQFLVLVVIIYLGVRNQQQLKILKHKILNKVVKVYLVNKIKEEINNQQRLVCLEDKNRLIQKV